MNEGGNVFPPLILCREINVSSIWACLWAQMQEQAETLNRGGHSHLVHRTRKEIISHDIWGHLLLQQKLTNTLTWVSCSITASLLHTYWKWWICGELHEDIEAPVLKMLENTLQRQKRSQVGVGRSWLEWGPETTSCIPSLFALSLAHGTSLSSGKRNVDGGEASHFQVQLKITSPFSFPI